MHIKSIKQKTVVEQVLSNMKELIADGTFPVGEKFPSEPELAEMFGIGRSSVREAVKILQYLGILELKPSKGTYVSDNSRLSHEVLSWAILLGQKDFFELIALRRSIERTAIEDFIQMKDISEELYKDRVGELEKGYNNMVSAKTPAEFIEGDYNFHGNIIKACGNSLFNDIYLTLRSFMHEEIKRAFESAVPDRLGEVHAEHMNILSAAKEKRLRDAIDSLNVHIDRIEKRVQKTFR